MKSLFPKSLLIMPIIALICGANIALGDDVQVTPSLSMRQEYNDNILYSADNEIDDFVTTLTPAIYLQDKTERFNATLNSKLDAVGYASNDTFNAFETSNEGRINYKFTPLLSGNASASYEKDSRPGRDLETTGLALNTSKREKQLYTLGGVWTASEKVQASATIYSGRNDYEDVTLSDVRYRGYDLGVGMNLEEYFSNTVGRTNLSYTRYDYTTSVTRNYLITMGFDYNLNERYVLSVQAGPRYTDSDYLGINSNEWGVGGSLSLDVKIDEITRFSITLKEEQTDVSGSAGTAARTSISAKINRNIHDDLRIGLTAEYRKNKTDSSISSFSLDEKYYSVSPHLNYKVTDDLSLQTVYRFTRTSEKNLSTGDVTRNRNLIYAGLKYKFPLFD